jgi:hypothetical protein
MQLGFALGRLRHYPEAVAELRAALEQDSGLEAARAEIKRLNAESKR